MADSGAAELAAVLRVLGLGFANPNLKSNPNPNPKSHPNPNPHQVLGGTTIVELGLEVTVLSI